MALPPAFAKKGAKTKSKAKKGKGTAAMPDDEKKLPPWLNKAKGKAKK